MSGHTFDRGGQDDGTLMVSIDKWYGDDYVTVDLNPGVTEAHLTAARAREVAADLIAHADYLEAP